MTLKLRKTLQIAVMPLKITAYGNGISFAVSRACVDGDAEGFMAPLIHAEFMHEIWGVSPTPPRRFHKLLVCHRNYLLRGTDIPNLCPN